MRRSVLQGKQEMNWAEFTCHMEQHMGINIDGRAAVRRFRKDIQTVWLQQCSLQVYSLITFPRRPRLEFSRSCTLKENVYKYGVTTLTLR
jgi:hypothetical protein